MAPKRIHPPKKSAGSPKRFIVNFRTTAEKRELLEKAAARSDRSLIQEVEHRLDLASWLLEQMRGADIWLSDLEKFSEWANLVREAAYKAGEDRANWFEYTGAAPFSADLNLRDPAMLEVIAEKVRARVQKWINDDCRLPPAPEPPTLIGASDDPEQQEADMQRRFIAHKAAKIFANRTARAKGKRSI